MHRAKDNLDLRPGVGALELVDARAWRAAVHNRPGLEQLTTLFIRSSLANDCVVAENPPALLGRHHVHGAVPVQSLWDSGSLATPEGARVVWWGQALGHPVQIERIILKALQTHGRRDCRGAPPRPKDVLGCVLTGAPSWRDETGSRLQMEDGLCLLRTTSTRYRRRAWTHNLAHGKKDKLSVPIGRRSGLDAACKRPCSPSQPKALVYSARAGAREHAPRQA
jgi:hypothetical protein